MKIQPDFLHSQQHQHIMRLPSKVVSRLFKYETHLNVDCTRIKRVQLCHSL